MADQLDETRFFSLNEEEAEEVDALIADTKKTIEYSDILMAPNPEPEEETPAEEPAEEHTDRPQKIEKPPRRRIRLPAWLRAMLYVFCVLGSAALLALFAWVCADDMLGLTKRDEVVYVTVHEGDTIKDIAQSLEDADLIEFQWLFRFYGWFSNAEEKIDPGTYELNKVFDYHALVNGMIATAETRATVTIMIPEGYECSRIFELLEEYGVCSAEDLYETAANHEYEYEFLQHLEYGKKNRLEG